MSHTIHPTIRGRSARVGATALVVALVAALLSACSPPSSGTPQPAAKFCEFWDRVEEAPPTADQAVLVTDDVVALADATSVEGADCEDPAAKVELDGAVLAEGDEVPSEQGNASSEPVAAVTGDEIAAGEPVLENVRIRALTADIVPAGIRVRGNVDVRLSGQTSTIGFVGTLTNLNTWSVTLSSNSLMIPGVTQSPASFTGTLNVRNGVPTLSLTASVPSAKIGDVVIGGNGTDTVATIAVTASPTTGVTAAVSGGLRVGTTTASGTMNVAFDRTGALVSAKADISARLVGSMPGNKKVDLTGQLKLDGNATQTSVSFRGSGIVGDLQVNEANGSLTLAVNKATFVGVLDVQQGANVVRFNGSIVWDGITAYTPYLSLEGDGEFSGTLPDGQTIAVAGTMSTEIIGGQHRSVVTGSFKLGTLQATGTAVVEGAGTPTTTLEVDAALANAGFNASLSGAVVITDGVAESVQLDAVVNGSVQLGDATLTGATLEIRASNGNPLDLKFTGGLQIGSRANVSGTVAASFGPNGQLISLEGQMVGSLALDSWALVNFSGRVIASPDQVTLSGSGGLSMTNFPLGVTFNGTFTSSLNTPSWSLNGTGRLRLASIEIASARLSLSQTAGMRATRAGFYFSLIGIPFYFEGDFYMRPSGGCERINITGGSFLMRPLLAATLPGVVGCPVNI